MIQLATATEATITFPYLLIVELISWSRSEIVLDDAEDLKGDELENR